MEKHGSVIVWLGLIATILVGLTGIMDIIVAGMNLAKPFVLENIEYLIPQIICLVIGLVHIGLAIYSTIKLLKDKEEQEGFRVTMFDVGIFFFLSKIVLLVTFFMGGFGEDQLFSFIFTIIFLSLASSMMSSSKIYKRPGSFKRRRIGLITNNIIFLVAYLVVTVLTIMDSVRVGYPLNAVTIIEIIVSIIVLIIAVIVAIMFKPTHTEKDPFTGETITTQLGEESNHMMGISTNNNPVDRRASRDDIMNRRFNKRDE